MPRRPRPAADAVAQPDRGRPVRPRRRDPAAGAERAGAAQRHPRPRALGDVVPARARRGPPHRRVPAAPAAGLELDAGPAGDLPAGRRGPHRPAARAQRRHRRRAVRLRGPPLRHRGRGQGRRARAHRPRWFLAAGRPRAAAAGGDAAGGRWTARLAGRRAAGRGRARHGLHRRDPVRRRALAGRVAPPRHRPGRHRVGRRRGLPLAAGVHRRLAARAAAPHQRGGRRADDLPAGRVPQRPGPRRARPRAGVRGRLGHLPA